jgi:hypothetical protein
VILADEFLNEDAQAGSRLLFNICTDKTGDVLDVPAKRFGFNSFERPLGRR